MAATCKSIASGRRAGRSLLWLSVGVALCLAPRVAGSQTAGDRRADRTAIYERTGRDLLRGFRNMYQPHVVAVPDEEYPFRMWFFGWSVRDGNPDYPGCDAIFLARGRDLEHWEVCAGDGHWDDTMSAERWVPVLCADDKPYDQWHNGDPSVVLHEGRYYMAYSATGFDRDGKGSHEAGDTDGDLLCVMGAVSDDGIEWTRTEEPLLMWREEVGQKEEPTSPEYFGMYHRPSLMRGEDRWRLWFDYWHPRHGVSVGYAENAGDFGDASQWSVLRAGDSPVLPQWPNPDVVKAGDRYFCFGDPPVEGDHPWTARQLSEAVSEDGLNWTILGRIRPEADAPACHVPEAFVLERDGETWLHLFYACQIGGEPYDYRYDRIRAMRRRVE